MALPGYVAAVKATFPQITSCHHYHAKIGIAR